MKSCSSTRWSSAGCCGDRAQTPGSISRVQNVSVITEAPDRATIGARPVNSVTGHAPEIFFHAIRADHEAAGTSPAEGLFQAARLTNIFAGPSPCTFSPAFGFIAHCRCLLPRVTRGILLRCLRHPNSPPEGKPGSIWVPSIIVNRKFGLMPQFVCPPTLRLTGSSALPRIPQSQ